MIDRISSSKLAKRIISGDRAPLTESKELTAFNKSTWSNIQTYCHSKKTVNQSIKYVPFRHRITFAHVIRYFVGSN